MRVLITGASGFLGQQTVKAFLQRGHSVHAVVRPAIDRTLLPWIHDVELVCEDLRRPGKTLDEALRNVDAVVHLAAGTSGSLEDQLVASVTATENLLKAMDRVGAKRLVLAGTLSVYAWHRVSGTLDEESPLEDRLYERDAYAIAKTWQERIVRQWAERVGGQLTILRPGYIWGKKLPLVAGAGLDTGRRLIINGPLRRLPLTHVDNCADCFAAATEHPAAVGQTFNVIDSDRIRAWQFAGDYLRQSARRAWRMPMPGFFGSALAGLAKLTSKILFGKGGRLPAVLVPIRYQARFKSARFPNAKLHQRIGWQPPHDYRQCLALTYQTHRPCPVHATKSTLPSHRD
ncbi:MAG: NAD(P)-dependent oxidoreductase [Opitutales bacterium]|nr:NAD(P)-dependent oxidoreductase [Opitutales bacterium]MCH8541693.1 NAD(P)-dependent oxidoreductase [Opitutales bacterium]